MSSSFEKSPSIFSFVIALELVDFICQAEKPLTLLTVRTCENKTVVIFSLEVGKTKTIEHKFKEPTGIAFFPVLDVVAVCDSSDCVLVLFAKNGDGVLVVNCPKEISPIHVSSFQGVESAIFLASSTSMLYKMKVTLGMRVAEIRERYWRRWLVIARTPLTVMKTDQLLHQSFHVSVAFGVLGRRVLLLMVAGFVYTHRRKSFGIGWRPSATATKLTV